MKSWSKLHSCSGSREGIALVVTLAFIVLLTILIVSFIAFTRLNRLSTASYSKSIQAQEIAEGGLQDILFDLHSEIAAGSLQGSTYTQGTNSYATVYIPTTNLTAEPARIGYANTSYTNAGPTTTLLPPTLIRVSRATGNGGDSFFTAPSAYFVASELPINRASNVPTTTVSVNGRSISGARWNKTYLLAAPATAIPSSFTNTPPDWVYVTRTGSRVCTISEINSLKPSANLSQAYSATTPPPASPVVGRYAFVMYNEGSLLDVNVAGYVAASTNMASVPATNNPAGVAQAVYGKSYLSYADLTQIPGFGATSKSGPTQQAKVDALVSWRNASAAASAGATLTGTNYLNAVFNGAQNGFLSFGTTSAGGSDSPFLGRQDLINYFASIDANPTTTSVSQALPYLGTFSRALNWPSWHPTMDSTNMPGFRSVYQSGRLGDAPGASTAYGWTSTGEVDYLEPAMAAVPYRTQMDSVTDGSSTTGATNCDTPNVRFAASGTVNHYSDTGTVTSYTVNAGDPLLQHRFSLARLGWFNSVDPVTGPSPPAVATAIQACFGLKWGTDTYGNPCWVYVGSAVDSSGNLIGNTVQSGIETLSMVGNYSGLNDSNPREPNFFELLKAGILSGSLGKDPGPASGMALNVDPTVESPGRNFKIHASDPSQGQTEEGAMAVNDDSYFADKDHHVLQIGANIIDQYDTDSYPTAIYLKVWPETMTFRFNGQTTSFPASANPEVGPINTVYGIENLPYPQRFYSLSAVTAQDAPDSSTNATVLNTWLIPEVYQPFQQPTVTAKRPTGYLMRAYGQSTANWYEYQNGAGAGSPTYAGQTDTNVNFDTTPPPPDGYIYFKDPTGTNFYQQPQVLTRAVDNGTASINEYPTSAPYPPSYGMPTSPSQEFLGFHLGWNHYHMAFTTNAADPATLSTNSATGWVIGTYSQPNPLLGFCVQYSPDSGAHYLPYAWWSRHGVAHFNGGVPGYTGTWDWTGTLPISGGNPTAKGACYVTWRVDPLTDRFSCSGSDFFGSGGYAAQDQSYHIQWPHEFQDATFTSTSGQNPAGFYVCHDFPNRSAGFFYHIISASHNSDSPAGSAGADAVGFQWPTVPDGSANDTGGSTAYLGCWAQNEPQANWTDSSGVSWHGDAFYADDDGVIRPGDDVCRNITTADGSSMVFGASTTNSTDVSARPPDSGGGWVWGGLGSSYGTQPATTLVGRRHLVLNRPFRSVGELGYTYRDLPFKTLDFFTTYSADSALLDLFSVTDEPGVVAGEVDLNNAPTPVVQAVLSGGYKQELDPTYMLTAKGEPLLATSVTAQLNSSAAPNPLMNRADLVGSLGLSYNTNTFAISGPFYNGFTKLADQADKAYLEAPVRALSGVTNTRTWNLLVDIIAQSGHLTPTAASLGDFVVEGEKRYWLHIAIDRYTGKIIDQQLESVYE